MINFPLLTRFCEERQERAGDSYQGVCLQVYRSNVILTARAFLRGPKACPERSRRGSQPPLLSGGWPSRGLPQHLNPGKFYRPTLDQGLQNGGTCRCDDSGTRGECVKLHKFRIPSEIDRPALSCLITIPNREISLTRCLLVTLTIWTIVKN